MSQEINLLKKGQFYFIYDKAQIKSFKPSSGSLIYLPENDYVNADKFTFMANDGKTDSNMGTVTIHVTGDLTSKVKPYPLPYWRDNLEKTQKLLPMAVGNITVDNSEHVIRVLSIGPDNHNIYENVGAQILTAKLNIRNEVTSCNEVNQAIKYGDDLLHSIN